MCYVSILILKTQDYQSFIFNPHTIHIYSKLSKKFKYILYILSPPPKKKNDIKKILKKLVHSKYETLTFVVGNAILYV